MFSLNEHGNSVLIFIRGFVAYFYAEAPDKLDLSPRNLENVIKELNIRAKKIRTVGEDGIAVRKIEVVEKESIKEYKGKGYKKPKFLKIFTNLPTYVASLRSIFE